MEEELVQLLDAAGWDMECHSPREIRHRETGSFATLWAAEIVIDALIREAKREERRKARKTARSGTQSPGG